MSTALSRGVVSLPLDFEPQILLDMLGEGIVDFGMPWDGLLLPSRGIAVDVVASPMPLYDAPLLRELTNELAPFGNSIT